MAQYPKILSKGYYSSLAGTSIEQDKLRFTLDTGQIFLDTADERVEFTDFVKGLTEEQIQDTFAPLPKFYLSSDTHKLFYHDGEEWLIVAEQNADSVDHATNADTATYATKAGQDSQGQAINSTYIKNVSVNGKTVTFTKGNGSTFSVTTQDTTYTNMKGATSSAAGTAGLVPAPAAGDQTDFLRGDGTWAQPSKATNADTATYAKKAGQDSSGQTINSTYIKNASINNRTITFTKGNNSTFSFQTPDYVSNAGTATYAQRATGDASGNNIANTYAPINSPVFTGAPSVPTPSSSANNTQIANTSFVRTIVDNAIAGVVKFDTQVYNGGFSTLPDTGTKGVIYFVPSTTTEGNNVYDEYLWNEESSNYEKIGSAKIDLSNYVNSIEVTGTGNAITGASISGNKISFTKGSSFLTQHPKVTTTPTNTESAPEAGSDIEVIDSITLDSNGHVTSYQTNTVTIPNTVAQANKLTTRRTISLTGNVTGSTTFDGSGNVSIAATVVDDSHNHTIANVDGLQTALNDKLDADATAVRATGDSAGQNINTTYIKDADVSGRVITFTKGNGSTFSITTQDSTTSLAGLGITATAAELNYMDGVTSNVQTQLNGKAPSSHTHNYAGSSSAGGAANSAVKLQTARTISLTGDVTGSTTFDGSGNVSINATVADDSHNHTIANVDGLQTALDKKLATTGTAAKATADSAGQNINTTYIKDVGVNGRTVTFTKGNGSTFSITTQDTNTTYTLGSFGITATAAELNYMDGVTSNVQTQLNNKSASTHTHKYAGSGSAGGAANSAVKLQTARTISLTGDVTGSTTFDGSGNVSITATVADDSHNHTIANIDNLQTTLNNKMGVTALTTQDLDETRTPGFYYAAGPNTVTNKPDGVDAFGMIVYRVASGYICQELIPGNDLQGTKFTRIFQGSDTWTDWMYMPTFVSNPTSGQVIVADDNGQLKSSGFTIAKSVPSDAKFTDTTYTLGSFGITATAAELNYTDGVTSNIQTQLNNKSASTHTHNYAGSGSAGGAANSAVKLQTARTITLSGDASGSTTFDGSKNITLSVTVKDDSHNHTIANIDNLQSTLDGKLSTSGTAAKATADSAGQNINTTYIKNAAVSGRTITFTKGNGSTFSIQTQDSTATLAGLGITATAAELNKLDGVTATSKELNYVDGVTSNIQTQLNGKAPSSHTHNYAGSSSAGGAANSATKLATARTISLTGDITGSTTFDGSANKSIDCTVTGFTDVDFDFGDIDE